LERHENRHWVWYAPDGWSAAWGQNGIDITPESGPRMVVSVAWSGNSPVPYFHDDVFNQLIAPSLPGTVTVIGTSAITDVGGADRQVWQWKTSRLRGKVKIFTFDLGGAYGLVAELTYARTRLWADNKRLLDCIQSKIQYTPQNPVGL
jgi:hypothetical protein